MTFTEVSTQSFYSISQLYSGDLTKDLQLHVKWWGNDAVQFSLVNLRYNVQKLSRIKCIAFIVTIYGLYKTITLLADNKIHNTNENTNSILQSMQIIDTAFLMWLLYHVQALFSLIKSEKLLFCLDFALHLETEGFMSRSTSNMFISATDIHDIVLNEVIENLDVHYVLILRTKGHLFQQQPIIPMFNSLKPSVDCLQMVYKNVNKLLKSDYKC